MKELNLKITGCEGVNNVVVNIDGAPVKLNKDKFGNLICKYQTEKEEVKLQVTRLLDVGGPLWFVTQLFFFIITLFGLFGLHHKEKCIVIDYEAEVTLKEKSQLTLQLKDPNDKQKTLEVQTELAATEKSNEVYVDTKAKKVVKGLKLAKFLLAIATIVIVIAVVSVKTK